jgi:hypothetical protein
MASLFKRIFAVAEVDGITFWSRDAFNEYMVEKRRKENGLNRYTFRVSGEGSLGKCMSILEGKGIFDYEVHQIYGFFNVYNITYIAKNQILVYKD